MRPAKEGPRRFKLARGRKRAPKPCPHPDAWVPTGIYFTGSKAAGVEVFCVSCNWSGRVPVDQLPKNPVSGRGND